MGKIYTYEEIANKLGLTIKEVKEIEKSALKKLRHPKIGRYLKDYISK
jgi:RNA polymerase primary sigma factor